MAGAAAADAQGNQLDTDRLSWRISSWVCVTSWVDGLDEIYSSKSFRAKRVAAGLGVQQSAVSAFLGRRWL